MVSFTLKPNSNFLPHDISLDDPARSRKTHRTPNIIAALTRLTLGVRIKANFDIAARNDARIMRKLTAAEGDPESDAESVISILDQEFHMVRRDQDLFRSFKPLLNVVSIGIMNDMNENDRITEETRVRDASKQLDVQCIATAALSREPDVILSSVDPTAAPTAVFPEIMLRTTKHKHNIPFPCFLPTNLQWINANIAMIPTVKLSHIPDKPIILNTAELLKKLSAAGKPADELFFTFQQFQNTSDFYYQFMVARYEDGIRASRPLFFAKHFAFFLYQGESEELFRIWRTQEEKLRSTHLQRDTEYNQSAYDTAWTRVQAISDAETLLAKQPRSFIPSPPSTMVSNKHQTKPYARDNPHSSGSAPFLEGSKVGPRPRCIGCGLQGHKLNDRVAHGKFPFARLHNGQLLTPNNAVICISFNCWGKCQKGCPPSSHVCSLCGGSHYARDPSCPASA